MWKYTIGPVQIAGVPALGNCTGLVFVCIAPLTVLACGTDTVLQTTGSVLANCWRAKMPELI